MNDPPWYPLATIKEHRLLELLSNSVVRPSFLRCCEFGDEFLDTFYAMLAVTVPRTAMMFHGVDMQSQNNLVRAGIDRLLDFAENGEGAREELERLAESHGRHGLRITLDMYVGWIESMSETVRVLDPMASDAIVEAWSEVLRFGIGFMESRY